MVTITTAENSQQYKIRFSLIVEQILDFPLALTWLEKLRIYLQISNDLHMMFYVIDNSHSGRLIYFVIKS